MTKQTFIQGTLILIAAGMITRFLGFINRIIVARIMGAEGIGLYMMALPTLFLMITLTQFGLPVAISKRVAEADAKGDRKKIKKILLVSFAVTLTLSLIFTVGFVSLSPVIANYLLTDERALYPLLAISPIVPIVAVSAVIRGYFQGMQNMKPQAISQVIEQLVRITLVAILTKSLLPYGIEFAASGAMISVVIGELCALIYIVHHFKIKKSFKLLKNISRSVKKGKQTLQELFSIAVPTVGSRLVGSVTYFLEPILVAQSLAIAGFSVAASTKLYGELTGYVMPLLLLPTFITQSLSTALIPSISEAGAKNQTKLIHYRIHQAIRFSFASGALATVILFLFAEPILTFMYNDADAAYFVTFMAPFFLMLYFQSPLQAALQSLDLAKQAMYNSIIGSIVKFVVLIFLSSNPQFGITGVVISIVTSVVLVTMLHFAVLWKEISLRLPLVDAGRMILLTVLILILGKYLQQLMPWATERLIPFGLILLILVIAYLALLISMQFITREELSQLPFFKK
ncbi:MAG: stage V sporulation protein B [Bacillaceae bacterium]|nr:stage V sporulation protein B [Bacillaceae bacterium]